MRVFVPIILVIIFTTSQTCFAADTLLTTTKAPTELTQGIDIFYESGSGINTFGASKLWFGRNEYMKAAVGLGLSRIHFYNKPLDFTQNNYYPLYGIFLVQGPNRIAPYAKFAIDLLDALNSIETLGFSGEESACCDANFSLGVDVSLHSRLSLSGYGRFYQFRYFPNGENVNNGERSEHYVAALGLSLNYWY